MVIRNIRGSLEGKSESFGKKDSGGASESKGASSLKILVEKVRNKTINHNKEEDLYLPVLQCLLATNNEK